MVDLNGVVRETLALRAYDQRVSNIGGDALSTSVRCWVSGMKNRFARGFVGRHTDRGL